PPNVYSTPSFSRHFTNSPAAFIKVPSRSRAAFSDFSHAEIFVVVQYRDFDRRAASGGDKSRAAARGRFHDRLNRFGLIGTVHRYFVFDQIETPFNFFVRVAASGFHEAGNLAFEAIQLDIGHRRALHAPDLVAHHDAREKIA